MKGEDESLQVHLSNDTAIITQLMNMCQLVHGMKIPICLWTLGIGLVWCRLGEQVAFQLLCEERNIEKRAI